MYIIKKNKFYFDKNIKKKYQLGALIDSAIPMECASIIEKYSGLVIFIASNIQQGLELHNSIKQFTNEKIIIFPDWETLPFDRFSPHIDIVSSRISILYNLPNIKKGLLIVSIQTLLQKICSHQYLVQESFLITKNTIIIFKKLYFKLKNIGYKKENEVIKPGDFSFRTSLIDIYPFGELSPYRIRLLKNNIISIQVFNTKNQCTFKDIVSIMIFPKHEFPIHEKGMKIFQKNWMKNFFSLPKYEDIYKKNNKNKIKSGIEYLQPLFFTTRLVTLFDYLSEKSLIIYQDNFRDNSNIFWKKIIERYNLIKTNTNNFMITPEKMWITTEEILFFLKQYSSIKITEEKIIENNNVINCHYQKLPDLFFGSCNEKKIKKISSFLSSFTGKIIFSLTKKDSLQEFLQFLEKINIHPKYIRKIIDINQNFNYFYMIGDLNNGFLDEKNNLLFICKKDLLPIKINKECVSNIENKTFLKQEDDLSRLTLNDPIIHIEHGIGRYQGLTTIKTTSIVSEYLVISYAEEDKLYVPVLYLHLVSPYVGTSKENAPLHKLGGDRWNKEKKKISKTLYDHAANLLDIYARRAFKKGFSFKKNIEKYKFFCDNCPFETTLDQNKVIKSVLQDMYSSIPMDRLVCGDVGFGKTEIAMRASFLSISNNKQVAILVPTTLLAQQHFDNFKKRFFEWPVKIDILSRFRTHQEQQLIFKNIQNGKINIVIGTHKILIRNIKWYDLGLLIIDEEHRFGVNHKETIKKIYSNIDILTLTATPIPRTLNMAMTGIKDLSIISTPPAQRLKIKTFIQEYNPFLIKETILREISRGGQVYYIYNKVQNINNIAIRLALLIPEASIKIAHGKMNNLDLKKIMNEFYHNQFNVLICTTIIESGIDIPRANTIIIENSDHFGISQLHQLRGRIGRSNHQAYALLLVNNFKTITLDAKKRLDAISSIDNFKGGFYLSNQDLEIRGVGEILGKEQSGHIQNIGFSLYVKLLRNAVDSLKNGKNLSIDKLIEKPLEIELNIPSLLPEYYISDVNIRLFFYKKIASAKNKKDIEKIKYELIDRFGKLPDVSKNLIIIAKIRLIAQKIGIDRIKSNKNTGIIEFNNKNSVNTKYLLKIFQEQPDTWKMQSPTKLKFIYSSNNDYLRIKWINNLLKNL